MEGTHFRALLLVITLNSNTIDGSICFDFSSLQNLLRKTSNNCWLFNQQNVLKTDNLYLPEHVSTQREHIGMRESFSFYLSRLKTSFQWKNSSHVQGDIRGSAIFRASVLIFQSEQLTPTGGWFLSVAEKWFAKG